MATNIFDLIDEYVNKHADELGAEDVDKIVINTYKNDVSTESIKQLKINAKLYCEYRQQMYDITKQISKLENDKAIIKKNIQNNIQDKYDTKLKKNDLNRKIDFMALDIIKLCKCCEEIRKSIKIEN